MPRQPTRAARSQTRRTPCLPTLQRRRRWRRPRHPRSTRLGWSPSGWPRRAMALGPWPLRLPREISPRWVGGPGMAQSASHMGQPGGQPAAACLRATVPARGVPVPGSAGSSSAALARPALEIVTQLRSIRAANPACCLFRCCQPPIAAPPLHRCTPQASPPAMPPCVHASIRPSHQPPIPPSPTIPAGPAGRDAGSPEPLQRRQRQPRALGGGARLPGLLPV